MKYTILLLVWVPPTKAELEKKAFIWDCDPREQDSRTGLVKQGRKEANTSLHASHSPARSGGGREGGAKSDFETKEAMTLDSLANKLATTDTSELNYPVREPEKDGAHTSKIFLDKQEKQRQFEMKRKLHYNRGLNIKLARQLISKDLQREDEEDENKESWHATSQDKTTTMEESEEGPTSDEELQTQSFYDEKTTFDQRCNCLSDPNPVTITRGFLFSRAHVSSTEILIS
ncbi:protein phosphatase inhibitor 2-like [Eschrichtius robustus]|uniref:protein phosphatase inhibitor 2-like n=1 Tax=Eschrichtius robustus TaxID=9764 RepID=UPI0035C0B7ED